MGEFLAVADGWYPPRRTFTLVLLRVSDGHERWGDMPVQAGGDFGTVPAAAEARLQAPVAYRVTGAWTMLEGRAGPVWVADADRAPPTGREYVMPTGGFNPPQADPARDRSTG